MNKPGQANMHAPVRATTEVVARPLVSDQTSKMVPPIPLG